MGYDVVGDCCCWCLGCRCRGGRGKSFKDVLVRRRVGPVGSATGGFASGRAVALVDWRDDGGHGGVGGRVSDGGVWVVVIVW